MCACLFYLEQVTCNFPLFLPQIPINTEDTITNDVTSLALTNVFDFVNVDILVNMGDVSWVAGENSSFGIE